MTTVCLKKTQGFWQSLEVSGHTGYAESGSDIVCAGISTATIFTINLLDKFIPNKFSVVTKEVDGYLYLSNIRYDLLDVNTQKLVTQVFDNLHDILVDIMNNYPKYLKIKLENN